MDQETIRKIAEEVVRHLPASGYVWLLLIIQIVVTLVAAGAGAFLGEYLKTRGKNLATKADFESLMAQLRANTELVETVKTEISQKDWARREWTNVRRAKLEALLTKMHDCEAYLDMYRNRTIDGKNVEERDPQGELDTIATLYFPELSLEVSLFSVAYRQQVKLLLNLLKERLSAGTDLALRDKAVAKYQANWRPDEVLQAANMLKAAARELLVSVMGVDERG